MRDTRQYKAKPTGWDDNGGRTRAFHWFGRDGRALCGRWMNLTWNLLLPDDDVHPGHQCKICAKKRASQPQQ